MAPPSFLQDVPVATKFKKIDNTQPSTEERVIKKYPNRRLYDTLTSTYITLTDIKRLVMAGTTFKVRDAKTDEDLTRAMLLQIILEEEAGGTPLFSEAVLGNLIRTYGHAMQGFMGGYLEKNLQAFADMQKQFTAQSNPLVPVTQVFNPEAWTSQLGTMQEQVMKLFGLKKP
ncbi:MAG: polyhydroxyalkanoate synthesis repressor PhaR [Cytophagales bacterium]|nr:polyhydroxyalkanoate synthesis repressor PhaR [Cytophagales bacterium]